MRFSALAVVLAVVVQPGLAGLVSADEGVDPPVQEPARVRPTNSFAKVYYVHDLVEIRVPESPRSALDRTLVTIQKECPATTGSINGFVTRMVIVASLDEGGHAELTSYLAKVRKAKYETEADE